MDGPMREPYTKVKSTYDKNELTGESIKFGAIYRLISAIHGVDIFNDSNTYGQLVDRAFEEYNKTIIELSQK